MATRFGIVYAPWNHSQAPGNLLERVVGEIGIDHLTIPAVGPAVSQFRYFVNRSAPAFHTGGGWHYPPDARRYAGSIRPRTADWCGSRDSLKAIVQTAAELHLSVRLEVDVRVLGRYLDALPHLRMRNAFGDELHEAYPCLSNPDAREFLRAVLDDLRRYEPAGIQVCNWKRILFGGDTGPLPLLRGSRARRLSVLCFCPACRQIATAAGIDPDAAARSTQVELERAILSDDAEPAAQGAWREPLISQYDEARRADERRWLAGLARVEGLPPLSHVEWLAAAAAPAVEGWRVTLYVPPMFAPEQPIAELVADRGGREPEPTGLILPVVRATFPESRELVQTVVQAAQSGYQTIDFGFLDEAPPEALTWVKQAVRYARRE